MPDARIVDGLSAFADRYEGFIIDQWGVLHDGAAPYPGVLEAIAELNRQGKRIVLLSNSGRRAALNRERLAKLGFDLARFDGVVSSGEACWLLMKERAHPPWSELGRRCYLLTHLGDRTVVAGLEVELVDEVTEADFILASGLEEWQTLDGLRPVAEAGVARGLPMVCSNPDLVAVSHGELVTAPGSFARMYAELGGTVHYVGKPHRPIYEACLQALAGIDRHRIVCIGDSLDHDIRGANGMGLDSAFVEAGILAAEFPPGLSRAERQSRLDQLCTDPAMRPTWAIPRLVW